MKVIILAGGFGTRLSEETMVKPKPMVEIGNRPILWHIMKMYAFHGINEFVIALGYKGEVIKEYFLHYNNYNTDLTVDLSTGNITRHNTPEDQWKIHLLETGIYTETGGRIKRAMQFPGGERVMATYGDGVGQIDIGELLKFHRKHGKLATLTAVRPPSRFGALVFDGDQVVEFSEKPQAGEGWINGGFFVLEPEVSNYIEGDSMPFEEDPLENLARDGQLMAYKHFGYWQPMDTLREKRILERLWSSGKAPWKVW